MKLVNTQSNNISSARNNFNNTLFFKNNCISFLDRPGNAMGTKINGEYLYETNEQHLDNVISLLATVAKRISPFTTTEEFIYTLKVYASEVQSLYQQGDITGNTCKAVLKHIENYTNDPVKGLTSIGKKFGIRKKGMAVDGTFIFYGGDFFITDDKTGEVTVPNQFTMTEEGDNYHADKYVPIKKLHQEYCDQQYNDSPSSQVQKIVCGKLNAEEEKQISNKIILEKYQSIVDEVETETRRCTIL